MYLEISTCIFALLLIVFYLWQQNFNYWKKQKVPFLKPTLLLGNYGQYILQKKSLGEVTQTICKKFPNKPMVGAFYGTKPVLIVQDPDIIKLIMTKDFYYFNGREVSDYCDLEVTTRNMFFSHGDHWKVIRQNFAPLFTTVKMKNMFQLIAKCTQMLKHLIHEETDTSNVCEVKLLMSRYTMDCIGSCVFGIETNVMGNEVENNPFRRIAELISEVSTFRVFQITVRAIWPEIFYALKQKVFPDAMHEFFSNVVYSVIEERQGIPSSRNDLVDMIMNMKSNEYLTGTGIGKPNVRDGETITIKADDEVLAAQCIVFFAAGFETSSLTMAATLYELAKNIDCQEKVHQDVDAYLNSYDGVLNYECVSEVSYLEQCVDEVLRLYPVLAVLAREVREEYTLPNGVHLERGMRVHIPVYHIHRNQKYFPEPNRFRPERFSPEERKKIKPYTYLPFGEGPRICIGRRFARMQMMAGLVTILRDYRVELAEDTPLELELEPRAIVTQSKMLLKLKFYKR